MLTDKDHIAKYVFDWMAPQEKMVIGIGTGSTVDAFIHRWGHERFVHASKQNSCYDQNAWLWSTAISTSDRTSKLLQSYNIPIDTLDQVQNVDWYIDGADYIDSQRRVLKGLGGAFVEEKALVRRSKQWCCIAEFYKYRETLCDLSVPVAVHLSDEIIALSYLKNYSSHVTVRCRDDRRVVVDVMAHGNVWECWPDLLSQTPGFLEHGLFVTDNLKPAYWATVLKGCPSMFQFSEGGLCDGHGIE